MTGIAAKFFFLSFARESCMSRLPKSRIEFGLFSVGLLSLLASRAIGQTSGNSEFVLDLPTAVARAQARAQLENPEPRQDGVSVDEFSRQQLLFRLIAVGDDEMFSGREMRIQFGVWTGSAARTGPATADESAVVAGTIGGRSATVGGFLGALQREREFFNLQRALDRQLRMIKRLEADKHAGLIDIAHVNTLRQSIHVGRANLLSAQISLEESRYQLAIVQLGLRPETPVVIDDMMVRQFDLVDGRIEAVQSWLAELRESILETTAEASLEELTRAADRLAQIRKEIRVSLHDAHADLDVLDAKAEARKRTLTEDEQRSFVAEQGSLAERLADLEIRFTDSLVLLEASRERLESAPRDSAAEDLATNCDVLSNLAAQTSLVRSLARLEAITLEPVELSMVDALKIFLSHRTDWLKRCAALDETRRLLADGHDAENALAEYQAARRALIAYEDRMNAELRQDLRALAQLRKNFEIQREGVGIQLTRVVRTCELINEPQPKAHPEQSVVTLGRPDLARNLASALQALAETQDNLLSVYLQYYKYRIRLSQDLGVMRFDERGMWIDEPLDPNLATVEPAYVVPPEILAFPRREARDDTGGAR
jgi:hypothetical protein